MTKSCPNCKRDFKARTVQKFCSVRCGNLSRFAGSAKIECHECGKPFKVSPAHIKEGRKFCSRNCFNNSMRSRNGVAPDKKKHIVKKIAESAKYRNFLRYKIFVWCEVFNIEHFLDDVFSEYVLALCEGRTVTPKFIVIDFYRKEKVAKTTDFKFNTAN